MKFNIIPSAILNLQGCKVVDNNDLLQEEYKDVEFPLHICSNSDTDMSANLDVNNEANKLLMRSIKIDPPTLDNM